MTARSGQFARLFSIIALAVAAALPAAAVDGEFYVNTFKGLGKVSPKGTRASAMGGGGRGLADGVASLGVNPAALGAFQGTGVDIGLGVDWLDDGHDNTDQVSFRIGGAMNLERFTNDCRANQAIGGLLYTESYSGAAGVGMKRDQTALLFDYGLHVLDDFLLGATVSVFTGKWSTDDYANFGYQNATGYPSTDEDVIRTYRSRFSRKFNGGDFKIGGIYRVKDETTIGGTVGYTIGSYKERADYDSQLPPPEEGKKYTGATGSLERFSIGAGVAHQVNDATLVLGDIWYEHLRGDIPHLLEETNKSWGLSIGGEYQVVPEMLALRGGLYYDRSSYSSSGAHLVSGIPLTFVPGESFSKGRFGITAGAGLKLYNFELGYSLDVNSNGDIKNMVDFSTEW